MILAITLKYNGFDKNYSCDELDEVYDEILGTSISHKSYELDSRGRVHIHALCGLAPSVRWKDIKKKGFNIYKKPLDCLQDIQGWTKYMYKGEKDRCEIEVDYYSYHENLFSLFPLNEQIIAKQ